MDAALGTAPRSGFSLVDTIVHADIVVQGVIGLLLVCSILSWAIIVEKIFRLAALRRAVRRVERFSKTGQGAEGKRPSLLKRIVATLREETSEGDATGDLRARIEAALRPLCIEEVRRYENGLPFLATLASTAPFVGLFGTVWGIMHTFSSVATAKDTSLPVVAPGIAEALFATAAGLATAIPAVVAYNQARAGLSRCHQRLGTATLILARTASKVVTRRGAER